MLVFQRKSNQFVQKMLLQRALLSHGVRHRYFLETTMVLGSSSLRREITIDVHLDEAKSKKKKNQKQDRGRSSYRFVDRTRVRAAGGPGGKGCVSHFRIGRKRHRRPDGGHGGNGGSVVIVADPKEQSLRWTQPHVMGEAGANGSSQEKHGRNGNNTVLRVPCGVVVRRVLDHDEEWDEETKTVRKIHQTETELNEGIQSDWRAVSGVPVVDDGDDVSHRQPYLASMDDGDDDDMDESFTPWPDRQVVDIADLDKPGSYTVVAKGGRGGTGNSIFASTNGQLPSGDIIAQAARPDQGEAANLELELKLIADIGLVGFPNAGKSSLLAAMSRATPHIAPYPFTTLNPLVGYIEYKDGFRVCAADVPGLIAGAAQGRGKGHDFLRHLERTKALLYIVDAAGVDGRDPISDFEILVDELSAYGDGDLLERRCLVVANKMDLIEESQRREIFSSLQEVAEGADIWLQGGIIGISAGVTGEGLDNLSKAIRNVVTLSEADRNLWHKTESSSM